MFHSPDRVLSGGVETRLTQPEDLAIRNDSQHSGLSIDVILIIALRQGNTAIPPDN